MPSIEVVRPRSASPRRQKSPHRFPDAGLVSCRL